MASNVTNESVKNYFLKFIETEDECLRSDSEGEWYSDNWHHPENDLRLAAKVLDDEILLRVYVHKLRREPPSIKVISQKKYPLFLQAYEVFLQGLKIEHQKHPSIANSKLFKFLFIYGFDYQSTINPQQTYEDALAFSEAFSQFEKYQHIPGLLSKPDKFYPYAGNQKVVHRAIAALDTVAFMRDIDFVMVYTGLYGALFILLLSPLAEAKSCIQRFKDSLLLSGNAAKHLERVADFSLRFEPAASDYLRKISA